MSLSRRHFKIAEILAAFFTGAQTERDEQELEAWQKEKEANKVLAGRLLRKEMYEENLDACKRFSAKDAWQDADKRLCENRKEIWHWRKFIRYAAVILILLTAGMFYWWSTRDVREESPVLYSQIGAGTTGAKLTLGDGRVVDIVKGQKLELEEVDGTKIVTDSVGIDYSVQEIEDKPEVLNKVQTLTGMEYSLTLSDGTKVYLNAETKLEFPTHFKGERRIVKLEGEAYFDVSKDAARPFIVEVNSLEVRVLGTAFNLRSYDDEGLVVTTLVEGKVEVAADEVVRTITPGMQVVYEKENGDMKVQKVDVLLYKAWQSGKFIFKNERLEDIMIYLSKWYGFNYRFIDNHAKEVRIGARLDRYDNMEPIIEMLKRTGLVNITQMDKMFYISSAK